MRYRAAMRPLPRAALLALALAACDDSYKPPPRPPTTTGQPTPQPQPRPQPTSKPQPPADPCNGITYAGTCQGSTVVWCENNKLNQINCSSSGKTCGFDSANQFYNCL